MALFFNVNRHGEVEQLELNDIHIESKDGVTAKIFLDGVEVKGVRSFNLDMDTYYGSRCPELTLTIIPNKIDVTVLGKANIREATLK